MPAVWYITVLQRYKIIIYHQTFIILNCYLCHKFTSDKENEKKLRKAIPHTCWCMCIDIIGYHILLFLHPHAVQFGNVCLH